MVLLRSFLNEGDKKGILKRHGREDSLGRRKEEGIAKKGMRRDEWTETRGAAKEERGLVELHPTY